MIVAGGRWVRAYGWWERSPNVSNSTSFLIVSSYGNTNNNNGASNTNGVAVGFYEKKVTKTKCFDT